MASRKPAAAVAHQQGMSEKLEKLARLRGKKPLRRPVLVPLSDDAADELNAAEQALQLAQIRGEDTALAERRLAKAKEAAKADSVELIFEAAPEELYEQLRIERPPTDEEKQQGATFGKDFLYGLAALSSVDGFTEDEIRELTEHWSFGEKQYLFTEVLTVNTSRRALDLDALGK